MLFWKKKKINSIEIDLNNIPTHIAIIMDGNGRWAKNRALPRSLGHKEGAKTLKTIAHYCSDIGVKYLTVYTFSTENWKRPKDEVDYLMNLLIDYFRNIEEHMGGKRVRVKVIGDKSGLPQEVLQEVEIVEKKTSEYSGVTLNLAINYGSRDEIKNAVKRIANDVRQGKLDAANIDEQCVSKYLYTANIPDPELLIRPGGEKRISNYLLWQCAYSEFYFTDVLWPDFNAEEINKAIFEFQNRNRRFGGI